MEATINISDNEIARSYYQKGYEDCLKVFNRIAEVQAAQSPYLKGKKGLREYLLNIAPQTADKVRISGLPSYSFYGITYFKKSDVDEYVEAHKD